MIPHLAIGGALRRLLPSRFKSFLRANLLLARRRAVSPLKLRWELLSRLWRADAEAGLARLRLHLGSEPLSYEWGYERGEIISRSYVEGFMGAHASAIRGHCLEFQADDYASRFGGDRITRLDILHLDYSNPRATIIADLTEPNSIPADTFDCIICTNVLHLIREVDAAVCDLHRILKPGGVLLVAAPHLSMDGRPVWQEFWRYTAEGLHALLDRSFASENIEVEAYGNSLVAAGELRGLAAHEFTPEELNHHDARFALTVCARAAKGNS